MLKQDEKRKINKKKRNENRLQQFELARRESSRNALRILDWGGKKKTNEKKN